MHLVKKSSQKKSANEGNPFFFRLNLHEKIIILLLFSSASAAVVISAGIIYTLLEGSISFFTNPVVNIIEFFTSTKWIPQGSPPGFGILPLITGTTLIAGGAILIGTPIGLGSALFLSEFANTKLRSIIKPIIEILAGIPSIVYGFFALLYITPILRDMFGAEYFNAASAIIVIAIMVLPIIVSISDDALKAVPQHLRESSLAVGATKWETATRVVIPAASSGIIASVLLGLARALGETMVVLLVAGSIAKLTFNPFEPVLTMTAYIGQTATGDIPPGVALSAAFAVGLVLFIITYIINSIAARVVVRIKTGSTYKTTKKSKRKRIYDPWIKILQRIIISFKILVKRIYNVFQRTRHITLKTRYNRQRRGIILMASCLSIVALFLIYLLSNIISQGIGGLSPHFFTNFPSYLHPEEAGIMPAIIGSIYLMLLTMLFSTPLGVGAAIYLNEFAKDTRYTRFLRRIIQNLAGVPSIVFGLMGLAIFVRLLDLNVSLLAGALTLSILVLPIIVVSTEEALKAVPYSFREAARGVGSTKWQTVLHHVLPNAVPGILTGVILSLSRAIGETAPILFIGATFAKTPPGSIFDGFVALPLLIFNWTTQPKAIFHDLAASAILVLLVILLMMNAIAIIIRQRAQARRNW